MLCDSMLTFNYFRFNNNTSHVVPKEYYHTLRLVTELDGCVDVVITSARIQGMLRL